MANQEKEKKALVFGALNLDYVYQMREFVQPKQTVSSIARQVFCGGKGLNQALAMKRSGANVWLAGAVGMQDSELLLEECGRCDLATELIQRKACPSGHAIIQRTFDGENCIILYGGANQEINQDDIEKALKDFKKGDLILLQNEINQMPEIMRQAKEKGMQIVLNPSPMDEKIFTLPLADVSYLILNEEEGRMLCERYAQTTIHDHLSLLDALMATLPDTRIILTLGEAGAYYGYRDVRYHQAAYPVTAVDTTAAGDTFTGFLFGTLLREESIEIAMDLASKAAAIACTRHGAGPSIPTWQEVCAWKG